MCKCLNNVSFANSREMLGYQFPCVIVIMDLASFPPPINALVNVMTRATTSLNFILNTSLEPIRANEIPLYRHELCLASSLESRVRDLISDFARFDEKILIYDYDELLLASFVEEIKDEAEWNTTGFGNQSSAEKREESKKYSLVVLLKPTNHFGGNFASLFIPPVIEIMSVDDEDDLPWLKRQYDFERLGRGVLNFFKSYSD